ncbi:hypothetical protein PGB90_008093 [Kerria lacca]
METLPEKPSENDCCGSGCNPCIFDIYEKLLKTHKSGNISSSSSVKIRYDLLSPLKYKPFILLNIQKENANCNIYTFKPVIVCNDVTNDFNGNEQSNFTTNDTTLKTIVDECINGILPYLPGQHVIMKNVKMVCNRNFENVNTASLSRSYTPVSLAQKEENCVMKLLIKLYDNEKMSSFISQLKLFDIVFFRGPFGDFRHIKNSKYFMICAGTGLAPMYPIIKTILLNEEDESIVRLCFACQTFEDILFREEIRYFSKFWNFKARIYLSRESTNDFNNRIRYEERIHLQKLTNDALQKQLRNERFKILICGSESFNKCMTNYVEKLGYTDIFVF